MKHQQFHSPCYTSMYTHSGVFHIDPSEKFIEIHARKKFPRQDGRNETQVQSIGAINIAFGRRS